jgi:hypothetical protein
MFEYDYKLSVALPHMPEQAMDEEGAEAGAKSVAGAALPPLTVPPSTFRNRTGAPGEGHE